MSLSGFGRGRNDTDKSSEASSSTPSGAGFGNLTAFIDQGSEFEGKLSFKDTVRIDGRFSGEISSENTLIVGETGEIQASIQSTTVVISGMVTGDINATRQVVLHKTGRLQGDVKTPSLVMEEGAVINGSVTMGRPEAVAKANASAASPGDAHASKDASKLDSKSK